MGYSQVGIGTTTPNAQLDIQSSNQANPSNTDGILIPKIDAFPATNPGANQNGMLVFLTTTVGTNVPGFYYWNHPTAWVPIGNNNNSGWNLNGNAITSGQFIGTTNNQDLIFRRNSSISGRIGSTHTSFGSSVNLFNSSNTSAFGATALQQNSGTGNSAFGYQANRASGNGSLNSAFGINALLINSTGSNNTALGSGSLDDNTIGNFNTGVGSGTNLASSGLNNATAIGALAQVSTNNSMVLGSINGVNGATADVNVGIGTTSPSRRLHVVNSGSSGGTPFGTAGFVLESNLQVYQQFLTPSNRESGLLFGNQSSNIRAGILFNSGHTDGLSFRTGGNITRVAITNAGDMGMGTLAPQAALDIIANDNGVLVPRVVLTAANVQAPVVNPTGGALPESTLVYNTNSSGAVPNDVTPGFYYWQNNRWNRLGNENKTRYYTAVGTTDAQFLAGTPSVLVPEMSITLTPSSSTILVNFNASGYLFSNGANMLPNPNIESLPVVFFIELDGVFVRMFSTMTNSTFSNSNVGLWDIDFNYPITVQPGVSQTVSINYYPMIVSPAAFTSGDRIVFNMSVAAPPLNFSIPVQNHRVLTVIDP